VMDEDGVSLASADEVEALIAAADESQSTWLTSAQQDEFEGRATFPASGGAGRTAVQRPTSSWRSDGPTSVVCCDGIARAGITARGSGRWASRTYRARRGTTAWTASGRPLESGAAEAEPWGLAEARAAIRTIETNGLLSDLLRTPGPPQVIYVGPAASSRLATFLALLGAPWLAGSRASRRWCQTGPSRSWSPTRTRSTRSWRGTLAPDRLPRRQPCWPAACRVGGPSGGAIETA